MNWEIIQTLCMYIGLARFQFIDNEVMGLELFGNVTVCLELIPPTSILEDNVTVQLVTLDGTAFGILIMFYYS